MTPGNRREAVKAITKEKADLEKRLKSANQGANSPGEIERTPQQVNALEEMRKRT